MTKRDRLPPLAPQDHLNADGELRWFVWALFGAVFVIAFCAILGLWLWLAP